MDSCLKLLEYINKVAKEPMVLTDGEFRETFGVYPVSRVVLSDSFFQKDDCTMCGKCCPNETTAWTREGMSRILNATEKDFTMWGLDPNVVSEITSRVFEHVVYINGKPVTFYVSDKDPNQDAFKLEWHDRKEQPRCHWLFEKDGTHRCRIHPVRSVTCGLPHCRMLHSTSNQTTTIGMYQFGRNWRLKCPVQFGAFDEASTQSRIVWLQRLYETAKDCGVDTFLPEILHYLHSGNRSSAVFEAKPKTKLFTVR